MKIHVIHGPNLNLLGQREPEFYGAETLTDIDRSLEELAQSLGFAVVTEQYNGEGEIVDAIQRAGESAQGILINPAGYTHTSVAIRDALLAVGLPTVEVHLSNTHARESFRHQSLIADIVLARVMGFGAEGYRLALRGIVQHLFECS
jgi:3-dehydroquinate dehydratase-2